MLKLGCKHNNVTYIGTKINKKRNLDSSTCGTIKLFKCNICKKRIEKIKYTVTKST